MGTKAIAIKARADNETQVKETITKGSNTKDADNRISRFQNKTGNTQKHDSGEQ